MDISTLGGLIAFLGTATFLGFFKSQILEVLPQFQALPEKGKTTVVLLAAVVFGLLSYALTTYFPQPVIAQLQPIYAVIVASVTVWAASQGYHALTKPDSYEPTDSGTKSG